MSWLDQAKGGLGGAIEQAGRDALPGMLQSLLPGGLQGVLNQLSSSGFGRQVNSWLGRGENQPITVDDLRNVLSNEQVKAIAAKFGVPVDQALAILAGQLPQAVDQASPDGELKTPPPAA